MIHCVVAVTEKGNAAGAKKASADKDTKSSKQTKN